MGHPKTTLTSKGERGITQMSTKLWAIHKPREHLGVEKEGKKILIVVKVARLGGVKILKKMATWFVHGV